VHRAFEDFLLTRRSFATGVTYREVGYAVTALRAWAASGLRSIESGHVAMSTLRGLTPGSALGPIRMVPTCSLLQGPNRGAMSPPSGRQRRSRRDHDRVRLIALFSNPSASPSPGLDDSGLTSFAGHFVAAGGGAASHQCGRSCASCWASSRHGAQH